MSEARAVDRPDSTGEAGALDPGSRESAIRLARTWLGLAVGSLLLAGVLATLLVIARMPPFVHWVTDPLFFKRCLVVHVDLALVVWFYAFLGGLYFLIPARRTQRWLAQGGVIVSASGIALLVVAVAGRGVEPVLSNYVPVLDTPVFLVGLAVFGAGLVLTFCDGRLLVENEGGPALLEAPLAVRPGLRAAATAFLIAALTFFAGVLNTPAVLPAQPWFELAFWGGGHVLQFASSAAMVAVWMILVHAATGRAATTRGTSSALFGLLVLPLLAAPVLPLWGTESAICREGFTNLMRWGIFPVVSVFLVLCLRTLASTPRAWSSAAGIGFLASAGLCVLGFVLGALIRGPNTMVPAHYHASIGAVTAAFMTVTYVLLAPLGLELPSGRLGRAARWQPALFGVGQMVFAVGFGMAGHAGAARKAYGAEQAIRSTQEWVGLFVMGVGGLVAVCGGILFLTILASAWRRRVTTHLIRSDAWPKNLASTPSRG